MEQAVPKCWLQSSGFTGQNVDIQPSQEDWGGAGSGPPVPGAVLGPEWWAHHWSTLHIWHGIGWFAQEKAQRTQI